MTNEQLGKKESPDWLIQEVQRWVEENFPRFGKVEHLIRSAHWVRQLDPDADEAVVIAAMTHDMERAFPGPASPPLESGYTPEEYRDYSIRHSLRSARIVGEFLKGQGADENLVGKVEKLIRSHEFGGSYEQNLVADADSISFLEVNALLFISWIPERRTKAEVREKFLLMYNRIKLPRAQELAKPFFEKAMEELEKIG